MTADTGRDTGRARAHLRIADPVLARLIDERPDFDPRAWLAQLPPMDLFGALLFQVTGQQLSVAATRRTLARIEALFGDRLPSPAELLHVESDDLREAGLSWRKISTLRDLAQRFSDGRLDADTLSGLPDDDLLAELTAIPGIGPWTVQGALIVALQREDVVLPGDLALRKAVQAAYRLDHLPTQDEVLAIAEPWRPYRSLATSYLFSAAFEPAAQPTNDSGPGAAGRSNLAAGQIPHPRQGADMTGQPSDTQPTIVLVHGAWADATGFEPQIRALQERGLRAVGFGNPLRGIPADAGYLAEFLRALTGPIVLVGHSYGGIVISVAATGNDQVKALVYFNGWMTDEGETQAQLLDRFPGSLVGPAIRPVPYTRPDGTEDADLYLDPEAFHEAFAADVDPAHAAVMAAAQRPFANAAFTGPGGPPAWKDGVPCWYLLGTEDHAIPPALQRFMAERANATIVEVAASHVSFVSQPEAATQLILQAVDATTPAVSGA